MVDSTDRAVEKGLAQRAEVGGESLPADPEVPVDADPDSLCTAVCVTAEDLLPR
jgi:hypothetical protein